MTDHAETPPAQEDRRSRGSERTAHYRRYVFWGAAVLAFGAAAVAALAPQAAGPGGLVLLGGIAAAGLLLLYALAAGEAAARWLTPTGRGAAEREKAGAAAMEAFEALADPAVIVERGGAPRAANAAYRELAREAGVSSISGRPPSLDRVLGGHPGLAAAVFRLAKSVSRGEPNSERLPAAPFGSTGAVKAFDVDIAPLPNGDSLWRGTRARHEPGAARRRRDGIERPGGKCAGRVFLRRT